VASHIPIDATQASSPVTVAVTSYNPVTKSRTTLINALMEITPAVLVAAAEYATAVVDSGGSSSGTGSTTSSLGTFQLSSSGAITVPDLAAKGVKWVVKEMATVKVGCAWEVLDVLGVRLGYRVVAAATNLPSPSPLSPPPSTGIHHDHHGNWPQHGMVHDE
jgi:hypothetical protein